MTLQNRIESTHKSEHKNESRIYSMNISRPLMLLVFSTLPFLLGSCEVIAGIFKAGMGFGIFIVIAVIIAIVVFVMRMGKNRNS